jgi:hypothetical protein
MLAEQGTAALEARHGGPLSCPARRAAKLDPPGALRME